MQESCSVVFDTFSEVSNGTIRKVIMNSPTKSNSLDPIPTFLLKTCVDSIVPIITRFVNTSLLSGIVPDQLKTSCVAPILKKPKLNHEELKNYRPISNLKFLSKLLERSAASQIQSHFVDNNLYAKAQSAYRSGYSVETALLRVTNDILSAIDKHQEAVLVLLDLSAAFDTIDHDILLTRLEQRYGISGSAQCWFASYLRDRQQKIVIGNATSTHRL